MVFVEVRVRHEVVAADFVVLGVFCLPQIFLQDAAFVFGAGQLGPDEFRQAILFGWCVGSGKKCGFFEHRADGGEGKRRALCREVMEREGRSREHLVVLVKDEAGSGFFLHAGGMDFGEGALQRILVLGVQAGAGHLLRQSGRKDDLSRAYRTKAETGVQKSLVERRIRILCETFCDGGGFRGTQIELFLRGRRRIFTSRKDEARAAVRAADFSKRIDDDAVLHENDVAVLADEFDNEGLCNDLAACCERVEIEADDAVERVLADVGDAPAFELLAQHHAEDRRFCRIFRRSLREKDGARLWVCCDVQQMVFAGLAYAQENRRFIRLCDFINASAKERIAQLFDERLCRKAVEAHGRHLLFRKIFEDIMVPIA